MEEIYKVLRAGAAENTFRMLVDTGLLAAHRAGSAGPHHRRRSGSHSRRSTLSTCVQAQPRIAGNAILLGSLLIPLGLLDQHHGRTKELGARFGMLPLARRDVEFLRQILMLQRHLRDPNASPRHKRGIMHRSAFPAALMWLELHGNAPALVESWRALQAEVSTQEPRRRRGRAARVRRAATPQAPPQTQTASIWRWSDWRLSVSHSLVDFVDRLVGMREPQRDQQPDDRPRRIDLARTES